MLSVDENIEKLPSLIKDSLHHFNYNEKELVDYLSALFEESVDIDLYKIWITGTSWKLIKEEGMFKELARFIYDRI